MKTAQNILYKMVKMKITMFQVDPYIFPDARDKEIAEVAIKVWNSIPGPRVGDYVIYPDGHYERISYDWDDHVQTSPGGSFNLSKGGSTSFSGGLNPGVRVDDLVQTNMMWRGRFWMFHWGFPAAAHSIGVFIPCRVFKHVDYTNAPLRPGRW